MLTVGLFMAFTIPAFGAVGGADVKFSGSYYAIGVYEDNHSLKDSGKYSTGYNAATGTGSSAFYAQRLRLQTEFKIDEGLSFVTRIDALEKKWGDQTWAGSTLYDVDNRPSSGATNVRTQENIEFVRAYVDFTTAYGRFNVGYQNFIAWGTLFGDTFITRPGIKYFLPVGPLTVVAAIEKVAEKGSFKYGSSAEQGKFNDVDYNIYDLGGIYKWQGGEAGLMVQYARNATNRTAASPFVTTITVFDPYVKATFGKFYLEAEAAYLTGDAKKYDENVTPVPSTVTVEALGVYLHGKLDLAPAYVGFQFAWIRGDDPDTTDKVEGGMMSQLLAGQAFNPCLILWNDDITTWNNDYYGHAGTAVNTFMDNVWFYQIYGGFKPTPKLDVMASFTMANADKKPKVAGVSYVSDAYGTEFDLTATYKIFGNLDYMVGGAYLWTGDYFKGTSATNTIANDYLLFHKLTLSF